VELDEVLRTSDATRAFAATRVTNEVVFDIIDVARFARSGGNRQVWRAIVVNDPAVREGLRDLYLKPAADYAALKESGLVAWSPITDVQREKDVLDGVPADAEAGEFARNLHQVPALIVVIADLRAMASMDRDGGRYTFVGGATVYPFVWNVILAARNRGLVGIVTTLFSRAETDVRQLLAIPPEFSVAAVIGLGYPVAEPLTPARSDVGSFTTIDHFDGEALTRIP
jgi:nitroreductase